MEGLPGAWPLLASVAAGILLGVFEGTVVGAAQGVVLRRRLPGLALRSWVVATVIGAMVAWGLGMLPSTLMGASAEGAQSAAEAPEWLTYVMAAAWGWWRASSLRSCNGLHSDGIGGAPRRALAAGELAGLVPGHAGGVRGHGLDPGGCERRPGAPVVVAATAAAGAVVGAVHGAILVRVLQKQG